MSQATLLLKTAWQLGGDYGLTLSQDFRDHN